MATMYSTSQLESATTRCLMDCQLTGQLPRKNTVPLAPVARIESIRILLALAAQEGWRVHHMDVKSAFFNGDLKEEVYVRQPPGFVIVGEEGKVMQLRKALYGLRQAPRAWNAKLHSTLKEMGFQQSAHEAAVYRQGRHWPKILSSMRGANTSASSTISFEAAWKKET